MSDDKKDSFESGLFFTNGGMPVPTGPSFTLPTVLFTDFTILLLEITDRQGAPSDYNAEYMLLRITQFHEYSTISKKINTFAKTEIIVGGDIRTIPDHAGNGARTLNGAYSWINTVHKGVFNCVQVRKLSGGGVLNTATMNVNEKYLGRYEQDGINIHPPNPTNKNKVWKDPGCSLASAISRTKPFSQGCWQPRPDINGIQLLKEMMVKKGVDIRRIMLNTTANKPGIIMNETIENARKMRADLDRRIALELNKNKHKLK